MPDVSYALLLDGRPLDAAVLSAVQRVEVEDHVDLAAMIRLTTALTVRGNGSGWSILDDQLFTRLLPLRLTVTIGNASPETLVDARVIETAANFSNEPGNSTFSVAGMDASVLLSLEEKVRPWPNMTDSDIASSIFSTNQLITVVEPTTMARQDTDVTVIQRGTDMQFLRQLAERNGYECYVEVNSTSGQAEGHFHPARLSAQPQGTLSVNFGDATNVNWLTTSFDMVRPLVADAASMDVSSLQSQILQAATATGRTLGASGTAAANDPLKILLSSTGLSQPSELQTYAQALVDRAAWAITLEGELNTAAYGGILRAKRPVLVRGVGRELSGTYYVERVLHTMTGDSYTQRFTLRRNAVGLSGSEKW